MRRLLLLVPVILAGCPLDEGFRAKHCGVVGGQEESGFEAVGLVETPTNWCTGTLIAPRVVLTAQHCFDPDQRPDDVGFRTGRFGETLEARGIALEWAGQFEEEHGPDGAFWWVEPASDVAVLVLDREPSVAPMPLRRESLDAPDVGSRVDVVGYGMTGRSNDDAGIKRSGEALLAAVLPSLLETARQAGDVSGCYGDSGGPLILNGEVVGVLSYFVDLAAICEAGNQYGRPDRFQDLIQSAIATADANPDPSPPDDSCAYGNDGICDERLYCYPGTDATDCPEGAGGGRNDPAGSCVAGFCVPGDEFCDEDLPCCTQDPDCVGGDSGANDRDGGGDGDGQTRPDDGKEPRIPEGCFPGICEAGDGYCDEDRDCCQDDPDCPVDC